MITFDDGIVQPVDIAINVNRDTDGYVAPRGLSAAEIREFQNLFGVNHGDSEAQETWFDEVSHNESYGISVVGPEFFFTEME